MYFCTVWTFLNQFSNALPILPKEINEKTLPSSNNPPSMCNDVAARTMPINCRLKCNYCTCIRHPFSSISWIVFILIRIMFSFFCTQSSSYEKWRYHNCRGAGLITFTRIPFGTQPDAHPLVKCSNVFDTDHILIRITALRTLVFNTYADINMPNVSVWSILAIPALFIKISNFSKCWNVQLTIQSASIVTAATKANRVDQPALLISSILDFGQQA